MINFIRNIWRYRNELYHDQQWDEGYLVHLIERKLRLMHEFLSSDRAVAQHTVKELRRLQIAIECARRINEPGLYMDRYPHSPDQPRWPMPAPDSLLGKAQLKASLEIAELEKRDWNLLWDTIKRYGQRWWD